MVAPGETNGDDQLNTLERRPFRYRNSEELGCFDTRIGPMSLADLQLQLLKVSHSRRLAWCLTLAPRAKVLGSLGSRYMDSP